MAVLNDIIPRYSNPATANFDFTDIATGLGYETYYGISTKDRSAVPDTQQYLLSPTANLYPTDTKISQTAVASTDFNFDTSVFNLPRTVKGTAIFNAVLTCEEADNQESRVLVQLKKVASDGTTTTNLTSQYVWDRTSTEAIGPNEQENMLMFLTLTQTTIKKGEKIRLVVTLDMQSGAGTDTMNVYCDPLARTILASSNISSQMKILIPYRIDSS